jgi:hypothetical protein
MINTTKEFKREERYIITKSKYLTDNQRKQLIELIDSFNHPPLECVVVESHWPNYEDTWKAIEHFSRGEYQSPCDLIQQLQARNAELEQQNRELQATMNEAIRVLNYANDYLEVNNLNTIAHHSRAHREMTDFLDSYQHKETVQLLTEQELGEAWAAGYKRGLDCGRNGMVACVDKPREYTKRVKDSER